LNYEHANKNIHSCLLIIKTETPQYDNKSKHQ